MDYHRALWCWSLLLLVGGLPWCNLNTLHADIVTISTSTAAGTSSRASSSDFIGILDGVSPETIGGQTVSFNSVPFGEAFQVGDIVGQDINASGGGRVWEYTLLLPGDAATGTGFENILFDGHAFERSSNNLEGADELTWELFLNGVSVESSTPGAGIDFNSYDFTLADLGGATINDVRVEFRVSSFDGSNEWFATRGILSAEYMAVPEQSPWWILTMGTMGLTGRRFRSWKRQG